MPQHPAVPPRADHGQASVELVALLPLTAALLALLWQAIVTGLAVWQADGAASAAARAVALGADGAAATRAARATLPPGLDRTLGVHVGDDAVTAALPVRAVIGGRRVLTVRASAHLAPQT